MVDINEIYKSNSDYIKAEDIGNQFWTFTIKTADVKRFDDGTSKILLTFHEWEKCLPLNVTNARTIADLYGHNSNSWIGRQIMLFTMMANFQGKPVPAIRIRAPQQAAPQLGNPYQPSAAFSGQPAQSPPQYQPGQLQPQANTTPGPGWNPNQSPQRPLEPAGGYSERNPPPPTSNDYGGI